MKTSTVHLLINRSSSKFLYPMLLILMFFSCEKNNDPVLDFEFQTIEIIYFPDKHISITFDILPEDDKSTYTFNWFNPDSLKDEGPFIMNISSNVMLDFEISDDKNRMQRFQYEIKSDTIDSLRFDYRNNYIGTYSCKVKHSFEGSTDYYQDTLTVVKNNSFNRLNILTRNDIRINYEGKIMTYLNSNGYYSYPAGDFYGYHAWVSFSDDSIHYSASGPLGFYYTNIYEGVKI